MKLLIYRLLALLTFFTFATHTIAACNDLTPAQIIRDDVLIVVNDNSRSSFEVGDYYCERRGINPANIAHVRVPVTNDVQLDQFISLRDQLIKHMQEKTLSGATPFACDTTQGYTRYYCPESVSQLRQSSSIRYVVMTKGLPIRFKFTDSNLISPDPTSIDNYLRFWLTNYFSEDVEFRPSKINFTIDKRAVDFDDGRGMREVNPKIDRDLIVGRIDGIDTLSAKRLVDRAIKAEENGIYGKLYGNKFGGTQMGANGTVGGAHWKKWLPGGSRTPIYPTRNELEGWPYLHGLFGELLGLTDPATNPAVRHTINSECLSYDTNGRVPKQCVTAVNRGDTPDEFSLTDSPPGTPLGRIESPDNALVHHGYLDGFSSLKEFEHLLNWSDSPNCNKLCADAGDITACKNTSTDAYKEIDTRCVRVAEGYMGNTFNSYPAGMMESWPTGWFQSVNNGSDFKNIGGQTYYYWQPKVRDDEGFDDNFSLWYSNNDNSPSAKCYVEGEDYLTPADGNCVLEKMMSINQAIDIPEHTINAANPQKITIRFKYRGLDLNKDVTLRARMLLRESAHDDGTITINSNNQLFYPSKPIKTLNAPNDPSDGSSWGDAEVTYTLDPDLHKHPQFKYNGIKIRIETSIKFEGELAFDNFTVDVNDESIIEDITLVNSSFDDGHRQLSGGDSAATFLSRLNGVAFWANISHHEFQGRSFNTHPYETLIYFLRGLPLGDAVWFAEFHNDGILYGDPLYSPIAVHLDYLSSSDNRAPDDNFNISESPLILTGHTLNGSGSNVSTTYTVDYCSGDDFLPCDQNDGWIEITNIKGLVGGQRKMSLGDWDISNLTEGDYVIRLAVTSSNSTNGPNGQGLTQTFYDYYTVSMYTLATDADGDGIDYQQEIDIGTNPWNDDTDEDGLSDGFEFDNGLNPLNIDTDGDGFDDLVENLRGSDPTNSQDVPNLKIFEVDSINGTDDGQSPFKTITAALNSALAGDTILLLPGNHNNDPFFLIFPFPIVLQGPSDHSASLEVQFFTSQTPGTIVVSDLAFSSVDLSITANKWRFEKSVFNTNTTVSSNTSIEFVNNLFTNASTNAVNLLDGSSAVLRNNTLIGNSIGVKASSDSNVQIINSIFSENTSTDFENIQSSAVSFTLTDDVSFSGTNGNISGDPLFIDPQNGDYHLMPESPAIDAGDPQSDFSQEPASPIGRINLGQYGNTKEASVASSSTGGGTNQQSGKDSGSSQIDWLLLFWLSMHGLWRLRNKH